MRALDAETPFQPEGQAPLAVIQSSAGERWDLPEAAFHRWWRALPEEDRMEFSVIYQGDETLARFVCALDYLTTMQARAHVGATMVEAYAIAANCEHDSEQARAGAMKAIKHDAVQALLDRLRYRSARQAAARITNRTTLLIEDMLAAAAQDDVPIKDKTLAAKAALSFMKMVSDEDIQERVERTRRGLVKARRELEQGEAVDVLTDEQIALQLRIIQDQIGPDKMKALLG
jgi:hypothetical protein